jgi:hypothetical protein
MSYDPYADGTEMPPASAEQSDARKRVQVPAILLIVVGVLNLFMAAWPAFQAFQMTHIPPEEVEEQMKKQNPQQWEQLQQMKKQGYSVETILRYAGISFVIWAVVDFLASFLVILGGVRMLALKNYGLAVLASVTAALPIISCTGCCGLGEIAGLWALVVLLSTDVRVAFR